MIKYILLSTTLIVFFELLGQTLNNKFKIENLPFNFFVGFSSFLGVLYISTSLLTSSNCSFYLFFFIVLVLFFYAIYLIFKNIRNIKITFNLLELLIIIVLSYSSLIFSYKTTLGDFHGFDSTYYLNLVVGQLSGNKLNIFSVMNGCTGQGFINTQYIYQSYYYFCSVTVFVVSKLFNLLKIEYLYSTIYIWIFQIIFTVSLMSVFVNGFKKYLKNKIVLAIFLAIYFLFGYSKIYWNSVYGFFGNTYRVVLMCYLSMYVVDYLKTNDKNLRILISLLVLAGCAFSSTFCFTGLLTLFGLFFVDRDIKIVGWYAISLVFPLINILDIAIEKGPVISAIISIIVTSIIYISRNYLEKIISLKYSKQIVIIVVAVTMFVFSYMVSGNVFDFSGLLDNYSQKADMTLDYFHGGIFKDIKLVMLIPTILYLIIAPFRKDRYSFLCWILIICFFNPFCCNFLNKYNPVYYRAYDIIINPFTVIYYYSLIHEMLDLKFLAISLEILMLFMVRNSYVYKDIYCYHQSFKIEAIEGGYDFVNKNGIMEADIIKELKALLVERQLKNPMVATPDLFTFSGIGTGEYIYSREYVKNGFVNLPHERYFVWAAFFPYAYYGQYSFDDINYANAHQYLVDAKFDVLVLDKAMIYHDEETDEYYPMFYLINRSEYPVYENDRYCLYLIEHD